MNESLPQISLTLALKEQPITIDGQEYRLVEMTGTELSVYRAEMGRKVSDDGKKLRDYTNLEAALISKCLVGPDGKKVSSSVLSTWPVSVQQKLFELARSLNGLSEDATEKEKNS